MKCIVFVLLKYQYVNAELACKITRNQILPPTLYKYSSTFLIQMFSEKFTWVDNKQMNESSVNPYPKLHQHLMISCQVSNKFTQWILLPLSL